MTGILQTDTEKFWFIQRLEDILTEQGLSQGVSDLITFSIATVAIVLLVWLVDFIGSRVIIGSISVLAKKSATKWDDFMVKRRFFHKLVRLFAAIVVLVSITAIFQGYNPHLIKAAEIGVQIVIVWCSVSIFNTFLDVVNDVYEHRPQGQNKSIKGYVQTAKIFIIVIGIIFTISTIAQKSPSNILLGLGASAAIFTLVFKDTILGFVASIQISAQDMIRLGDWIEVPGQSANGNVIEINVNNVKVQNWNNTISMIPIYNLVSTSFINWRGMQESDGRRFTHPILIDIESVRILNKADTDAIMANEHIAPFADKTMEIFTSFNGSGITTNLGLYRSFLEASLKQNPLMTDTIMVNHLPMDENGVSLQIYAFTSEKRWAQYEKIVSDVLEHAMATAPIFGIHLFQRPQSNGKESIYIDKSLV